MIFGLFGDKKKREAKQLNSDAPLIIEQSMQTYTGPRLREMAEMVVEHIARAHARYGTAEIDLKRAHYDYKGLHKEARRNNDQVALSALTLVIIHLRAEMNAPAAAPAIATIEDFTKAWMHDGDGDGDGDGESGIEDDAN